MLRLALMLACAIVVGLVNGALIRYGKFTPVAATLVTYIALQRLRASCCATRPAATSRPTSPT